jgi:hypothetical protein
MNALNPRVWKPWYEWNVPPLWVWIGGAVLIVMLSFLAFYQLGKSISVNNREQSRPAAKPQPTFDSPDNV